MTKCEYQLIIRHYINLLHKRRNFTDEKMEKLLDWFYNYKDIHK